MDLPLWLLYSYMGHKIKRFEKMEDDAKFDRLQSQAPSNPTSLADLSRELRMDRVGVPAGSIDAEVNKLRSQLGK